jgi:ribulose-phosphate 3-epimerase
MPAINRYTKPPVPIFKFHHFQIFKLKKIMPLIAPSLLSADFLNLEKDIDMINNSEADWFHLDVMDGRFVPNISFGFPVISAVNRKATKTLDVHLMILEPEKYIAEFAKAGANNLSVHIEACPHLHRTIQMIHGEGMKAGVAINPHTPISAMEDIIADIDLVCMMSVNPGFGGQKFIPHTLKKIAQLKALIQQTGSKALIEIDGGVTLENAGEIVKAGADVLVAGNTVFSAPDPVAMISQLRKV